MAKYTVNHICGHTHTHVLFGKNTDREKKLAWLETVDCPECYKAKQQAEKDAKNQAAAEQNKANNLPELTGTPKQIAWAETIRAEKVELLNKHLTALATKKEAVKTDEDKGKVEKAIACMTSFKQIASAAWWIENRECAFDGQWAVKEIKKLIAANQ